LINVRCQIAGAEAIPKIEYCGHNIDKHGLHKTQKKVEAVLNTLEPKTVTEVRAFLGLVNYYYKFLPNISTVVHPKLQVLKQSRTIIYYICIILCVYWSLNTFWILHRLLAVNKLVLCRFSWTVLLLTVKQICQNKHAG
jgi:hypothetical protein